MANEEELKILKQGVDVWNTWREEHPDEEIDLREADLYDTDLEGAYLEGAYLIGANLRRADLKRADLGYANLLGANLGGADLRHADLRHADLRGANLGGADLRRANITGAKLYNTARDDWKIGGIQCDYVYWDSEGKERTHYQPGEFADFDSWLSSVYAGHYPDSHDYW